MVECPRRLTRYDMLGVAKQIVYHASAVYFSSPMVVIYYLLALLLGSGIHLASMHFIAEHYLVHEDFIHSVDGSDAIDTFSYYGPFNYLIFNGGYHIEHHDFPSVGYRNLPKLRAMAPEYYDCLPHHTSYLKVMYDFVFKFPGLYQRGNSIWE